MNQLPFPSATIVLTLAALLTAPLVEAQDATPKRSAKAEGGEPKNIEGKPRDGRLSWHGRVVEGREPKYIEGNNGKAIEFSPQAPIIRIPAYPELRPLDGTTVCAWIKPTVETEGKQTVFRIEDGGDRRFMAIGGAKGIWGLWFGLGIAGTYTKISADYDPKKLIDGQWHHVAGTFDGKQMRLYIDGKKVSELAQPGKLAPGQPTIGSSVPTTAAMSHSTGASTTCVFTPEP